jgi:uncharacterized protein YkwD
MISKRNLIRIIVVSALIVLNIYLGKIFLSQNNLMFSAQAARLLALIGLNVPEKFNSSESRVTPSPEPYSISNDQVLQIVNEERQNHQLSPLTKNEKLEKAAQQLIVLFAQQNYDIENHDYSDDINKILQSNDYTFEVVADVAVIGPLNSQASVDHWLGQETQRKHLLGKDFTETGIASQEITLDGQKNGITVQILAKPCEASPIPVVLKSSPRPIPKASPVPVISDDDVVRALNEYRSDHKVHQLIVDQNLCNYAAKRVLDLQKKGTLDGHEGFKQDFANPDNLPESIKAYTGGVIGENLASQFCINGTTGQTFTATSATALIEWCFDSSTKGHREAQLNERYNAVCSRHGSNMYVVIFGE